MKKIMAGVFVFGIGCFVLSGIICWQVYKIGVEKGVAMGKESTCRYAELPAPSQYEMDNACIAWLMESNIKEAKLRICGKR